MEQWICSNNPTKKCTCYSSCNNIPTKETNWCTTHKRKKETLIQESKKALQEIEVEVWIYNLI